MPGSSLYRSPNLPESTPEGLVGVGVQRGHPPSCHRPPLPDRGEDGGRIRFCRDVRDPEPDVSGIMSIASGNPGLSESPCNDRGLPVCRPGDVTAVEDFHGIHRLDAGRKPPPDAVTPAVVGVREDQQGSPGAGKSDGQRIGREYVVVDGDVIEIRGK